MRGRRLRSAVYAAGLAGLSLLAASAGAGASGATQNGWIAFPTEDVDGAQIVSAPVAGSGRGQRTLTFSSAAPESPALSPDGSVIAFSQSVSPWHTERASIWTMRPDGSRRRRLAAGSNPTWSPDGRRLAFVDGGRLKRIRRDGSRLREVVAHRGSRIGPPLWSPDGAWIAYSTSGDELWAVRPDGTGSHRLAKARALNVAWSPNGRRLVYAGAVPDQEELFTVSVRGGRPRRLIDAKAIVGVPQWSPDGRRIAFWTESSFTMVVAADGSFRARRVLRGSAPSWSPDGSRLAVRRGDDVWVARADGGGARRVSRGRAVHSGEIEEEDGAHTRPVWTPDGRRIVFSRLSYVPGELVAVSPSGRQRRRLTRNRHHELEPAWSPDARMVAFVRVVGVGPGAKHEICVIQADGTRFRRLTRGQFDSQPTWSPDGRQIVFTRRTTGTQTAALYLVGVAGGTPKRIAPLATGHPAWAPGSLIALDGIELVRPTGEPVGRVTQPPDAGSDSQPDWAPDGHRFVFVRFEDPPCRQCEIHYLAVGELGSGAVRALAPANYEELSSPTWSPDGSRIAALVAPGGPLVTMRADGSDRRVLVRYVADEAEIDWGGAVVRPALR